MGGGSTRKGGALTDLVRPTCELSRFIGGIFIFESAPIQHPYLGVSGIFVHRIQSVVAAVAGGEAAGGGVG
jgi:hypothetical protein